VKVTVVIPTYNRAERLAETLQTLNQQTVPDFSVIVVNDGSNDPEYASLEKRKDSFKFSLQIIKQQNSGASSATNHGVALAQDGLIILFDDDILPEPECIAKHIAFHKLNTDSILSGSAATDPKRTVTDVQRYKLFMEEQWQKLRPDTEQLVHVSFNNFIITTANMSLMKKTFTDLGGFNTGFRDGYDVEFGFKALRSNVKLYFDRTIHTIHNDQISLRYYAKRQRAYTFAKRNLIKHYPEVNPSFTSAAEYRPGTFKRLFYSLFRKDWFVNYTESAFFVKFVPRALRYRIYGSTIAALSFEE
jgi:glycosyltransferase involved in cell wall biosynthesis